MKKIKSLINPFMSLKNDIHVLNSQASYLYNEFTSMLEHIETRTNRVNVYQDFSIDGSANTSIFQNEGK